VELPAGIFSVVHTSRWPSSSGQTGLGLLKLQCNQRSKRLT